MKARFPVSDHCDGRRFFIPNYPSRGFRDVLRWKFTSQAAPWPRWVDLPPAPPLPPRPSGGLVATYVNHATFLIQAPKVSILTDPIYSERPSPVPWLGPRRVHEPGVVFEKLPSIDVVLLSHDHYDHCDLPTLRRLAGRDAPLAITPLGNGRLLRSAGFTRVVELDWWQAHKLAEDCAVTLTPAWHWSNRLTLPRNGRLWGGFHVRMGGTAAYFTGDTGFDDSNFKRVRERLGAPDLAMIPIGAYEPRWFMAPAHCNPEEAVQIHLDLGARQSVAMHWGTFQLTDESREAPVEALAAALAEKGISKEAFRALSPGESLAVR